MDTVNVFEELVLTTLCNYLYMYFE